jgi:hypothetical protein
VWPDGLGRLKNFTPSGIEPTTFGLVAFCLNHYATEWPQGSVRNRTKHLRTQPARVLVSVNVKSDDGAAIAVYTCSNAWCVLAQVNVKGKPAVAISEQ